MKPEARRDKVLIQEVGGELVLYDQRRHKAHHLNRTAALVWQHCDGDRTVADLARLLQEEVSPAADEALVWQALARLGKAHLLSSAVNPPSGAHKMSRRQALGKLARAAAIVALVPTVTSLKAPVARADDQECSEPPCSNACRDQCRNDGDCPPGKPKCRTMECRNPNCPCPQKQCVRPATGDRP
jgi:hypothetical protein